MPFVAHFPPTHRLPILATTAVFMIAVAASGIQPERWVHSTEADFEAGELDGVVLTNLGDLKLATATTQLASLPEDVTLINDLETIGDTTYLAVGPQPQVLRVVDDGVEVVARPETGQIFSLGQVDGQLIVGTSGETAGLWLLRDQQLLPIVSWESRQYVWDLATVGQDLYVATGPEGEVVRLVDLAGHLDSIGEDQPPAELDQEVVLDSAQANVLCLAVGPDDVVYAGTDTDGLIYRLDQGQSYVVYDAGEPEIGALLVAPDGTVYAGTADAEQAKPGRLATANESESGRPSLEEAASSPVEADPGDAPDLPVAPDPQPLQSEPTPDVTEAPADPASPPAQDAADTPQPTTPQPDAGAAAGEQATDPGKPEDAEETPPTPEQLDALRQEVRQRLMAARKSGSLDSGSGSGSTPRPTRKAAAATAGDKSGNAVYRIDPQGFVSEVFRDSVMILNLARRDNGQILVGTGNEGQHYLIDPQAGEVSVLNDLESQQLLAMQIRDDGVVAAGSNPASLQLLQGETASQGTYTSTVLDAQQISLWGTARTTVDTLTRDGSPKTVGVETRSGNVADPELGGWSPWTDASPLEDQGFFAAPGRLQQVKIDSPPARYLQYRLTLEAGESADDAPVLEKIELAYVTPNLRPALTSLTAEYPDFAGVDQPASPTMSISWEATDDNGDRLLYHLEYKTPDAENWITLADDLTDTSYEWNTRQVPDGRYQVRVTVSDRLDNPGDMALTAGRRTDPVLLDNTPPLVDVLRDGELQPLASVDVQADGVRVTGTAVDRRTPIHSVAYRLNNEERYHPVLADDLIYDSTVEPWSATLSDLASGAHSITIRTLDLRGNASYASMIFEVP